MSKFKNGQLVKSISLAGGGTYFLVGGTVVGDKKITDIKVVMENGQMEEVPWFEVWVDDKPVSKWNGSMLEGVEL